MVLPYNFFQRDAWDGAKVRTWCKNNQRKILAELLSTMMLVLFGCMLTAPFPGKRSPLYSAFGFGMIVMFNVQIFGHISGAFMNPSVTLSAMIFRKVSITLGIAHIIAQCVGAIVGYGLLELVSTTSVSSRGVCVTMPLQGLHVLQSFFVELALTTTLILITCAIWDPVNEDFKETIPIKFGLSIVGLGLIGGPYTGASMNPARSLGPAVWTGIWNQHWIYWVGPFVGSILGTVTYIYVFIKSQE